jgi:hydroxyacylglutathione hydrolase
MVAEIIAVPAFSDNYIWAIRVDGAVAVVDPGDAEPVERFLAGCSGRLSAILLTHHHPDHVGGVAALAARRSVPVFGPAFEDIPGVTNALGEGDSIDVPGVGLRLGVLEVPGHTRGHIAYFGDGVLFCGDTLFACGCGRVFEGTPEQMSRSLGRLAGLPPATRVYCAHEYTLANIRFALAVDGDNAALRARAASEQAKRDRGEPTVPSTLADELATNPFLRAGDASLMAAAARRAGRPIRDSTDGFAVLRAWKNAF